MCTVQCYQQESYLVVFKMLGAFTYIYMNYYFV